jgi:GH15 family glucan-1,4-alpha-glucosidase
MTLAESQARSPSRTDGYAPIRDYAAIGNKRTVALVALDGSIDWMAHPSLEDAGVFTALLDQARGGCFALAPTGAFEAERRYLEDTNVLETTFHTAAGSVRVTDALSRPIARGLLWNQVIRRVDGVAGEVEMAWRIAPRFEYGAVAVRPTALGGVPGFRHCTDTLAVEAFDAGEPEADGHDIRGRFVARQGETAVIALSAFHAEPLTFSERGHLLERLDATADRWRAWMSACDYDGPWREAVRRSALALDLLVDDETGAIAAAATMGLPERIGGDRNYDYRYAWLRDGNLTLEAMRRLGFRDQVHTSLGWMLRTVARTHPRLRPMYQLNGSVRLPDEPLPLAGYRDSKPVLLGNGAQEQLQLGNYGDMFDMARHYVRSGGSLAHEQGVQLAESADFLARIWRRPEASIWELSDERQYTQGKLASWLALTHAAELAELGQLSTTTTRIWRREAEAVRTFVWEHCFSSARNSYVRAAGSDELDAAVLLAARGSFLLEEPAHLNGTIDAIRGELGAGGPLLYRYSGMQDQEGAFLACSFWLVETLVQAGRVDEAVETMDALVALGNDVGLYSEEIDPTSGAFLGNMPQALTHLALVNAAFAFVEST